MALKQYKLKTSQKGVSLIEFVIGLVLLAIVLLGSTLFFAAQKNQLDPVFQFRAVSLAEALAEQVLAVKYDANNNPFEQVRCGLNEAEDCLDSPTASRSPAETASLSDFTQLDDFQLWCGDYAINGEKLADDLNLARATLYQSFTVATCVELITPLEPPHYKNVTINVSRHGGDKLSFHLQRYNIR